MAIDSGAEGLNQSIHHPNAGRGAFTISPSVEPKSNAVRSRYNSESDNERSKIAGIVPPELLEKTWEVVSSLLDAREQRVRAELASTPALTTETLAKTVQEAVKNILTPPPTPPKTWAQLVASPANTPRPLLPPPRNRLLAANTRRYWSKATQSSNPSGDVPPKLESKRPTRHSVLRPLWRRVDFVAGTPSSPLNATPRLIRTKKTGFATPSARMRR